MKNLLKKLFQYVAIIFSTIIIVVVLLEGITRIFWKPIDSKENIVDITISGENKEITYGSINYKLNSNGLRYPELEASKSDSVFRFLAIGDSYLFGSGLPEDSTVTTKMEKKLNQDKSHYHIQVINAGIPGLNTREEFEKLKKLAPIYKPDDVIVFFYINDILERDTSRVKYQYSSWKKRFVQSMKTKSRFFMWFYYNYTSNWISQIGVPKELLPEQFYNLNDSKKGWVSFKNGFSDIHEYCLQNNIKLQFVFIPLMTIGGDKYPLMEMHDKVISYVRSMDVYVVDCLEIFSSQPYDINEYWVSPLNSHWSSLATTLVSDEIVRVIDTKQLISFCP